MIYLAIPFQGIPNDLNTGRMRRWSGILADCGHDRVASCVRNELPEFMQEMYGDGLRTIHKSQKHNIALVMKGGNAGAPG